MSALKKVVIHQAKPYRLAIFILIAVIITATSVWFLLKEDSISLQQNLHFLQQNLNLSRQSTQQLSDERLDLRKQNKQLNNTTSIQLQELIHYRLVITQGKSITKPVVGMVSINIDSDSTSISEQPLNLRYVQLIEGQLNVAGSLQPKSITITITQAKKTKLSRSFDWQLTSTTK